MVKNAFCAMANGVPESVSSTWLCPNAMTSRTTRAPRTIAMPTAMVMRARRRETRTPTTNSSSTR